MAPSISDQIRLEYAVEGSGLSGGRYNVRKLVRDVGKLTQLQKNVGTKAQRRAVGQAAADRATAAISGPGWVSSQPLGRHARAPSPRPPRERFSKCTETGVF